MKDTICISGTWETMSIEYIYNMYIYIEFDKSTRLRSPKDRSISLSGFKKQDSVSILVWSFSGRNRETAFFSQGEGGSKETVIRRANKGAMQGIATKSGWKKMPNGPEDGRMPSSETGPF